MAFINELFSPEIINAAQSVADYLASFTGNIVVEDIVTYANNIVVEDIVTRSSEFASNNIVVEDIVTRV